MKSRLFYYLCTLSPFLAALGGCTSTRTLASKWIAPRDSGVSVTQAGPAQIPASAEVRQNVTLTPIPANTPVSIDPQGTVTFTAPVATSTSAKGQTASYQAPKAYGPPTPSEQAAGDVIRWVYVGCFVLGLAAVLAAYSGHYLACIKFAAGAVAVPLLAHFFSVHAALTTGLIFAAIGIALIVAWYLAATKLGVQVPQTTDVARDVATVHATVSKVTNSPTFSKLTGYVEEDAAKVVSDLEAGIAKLKAKL